MELHLTSDRATNEEMAAVDAILGPEEKRDRGDDGVHLARGRG